MSDSLILVASLGTQLSREYYSDNRLVLVYSLIRETDFQKRLCGSNVSDSIHFLHRVSNGSDPIDLELLATEKMTLITLIRRKHA